MILSWGATQCPSWVSQHGHHYLCSSQIKLPCVLAAQPDPKTDGRPSCAAALPRLLPSHPHPPLPLLLRHAESSSTCPVNLCFWGRQCWIRPGRALLPAFEWTENSGEHASVAGLPSLGVQRFYLAASLENDRSRQHNSSFQLRVLPNSEKLGRDALTSKRLRTTELEAKPFGSFFIHGTCPFIGQMQFRGEFWIMPC